MGNLLARQRLELFARCTEGPVHPAIRCWMPRADHHAARAQFAATQREVIERLARLGLV